LHDSKNQVLVVDDDRRICELVSRMLERLGHEPIVVRSGKSAVDECERRNFDLILLDLEMPEMNGQQVFETLRDKEADLPVVFMTGYRTEELATSIGPDRAVGFLAKPFPLDKLRTTMESLLS